jgi:hypothetical protein
VNFPHNLWICDLVIGSTGSTHDSWVWSYLKLVKNPCEYFIGKELMPANWIVACIILHNMALERDNPDGRDYFVGKGKESMELGEQSQGTDMSHRLLFGGMRNLGRSWRHIWNFKSKTDEITSKILDFKAMLKFISTVAGRLIRHRPHLPVGVGLSPLSDRTKMPRRDGETHLDSTQVV